jgi:nitroreductase
MNDAALHLPPPAPVSDCAPPAALNALLSRYSVGAKHLAEPAPSPQELNWMVEAALRAPDHGGLVPFRFTVVGRDQRRAFAGLLEQAARESGKSAESTQLDRERALRAPMTVAVIARLDLGHPIAPGHEQWIAVGGAISNFLTAAHALGYAGKLLSGAKVRAPAVMAAFCQPGETLVGWIDLGTPTQRPAAKHAKASVTQVLQDWVPPLTR